MPRRVIESTLNASTIDILNVIRQNATYEYQQNVPVATTVTDIPRVGEVLYGHPALANEFINSLVNRIAFVAAKSAAFNNPFAPLKKGEFRYGESIEEVFTEIAKVVNYDADDAVNREFRRTYPDVKAAFHVINWRAMYPVTIQREDLEKAFLDEAGVQDLINKFISSIYTAVQYDDFLLTKYLMIKAVSHGEIMPLYYGSTSSAAAVAFRATSNLFPFMNRNYNLAGVRNAAPKERQVIIMDAAFNAQFDVEVLAAAFHMDKTDYMGRLFLIDDFTSFDNDRFQEIREASDGLEEVTAAELALMADVKAILLDEDWFQIYENLNQMEETRVGSGLYWNYFYHHWQTVSSSPFANAVAFISGTAESTLPESVTLTIDSKSESDDGVVLTFAGPDTATLNNMTWRLVQTEALTTASIAVVPAGAVIIPSGEAETAITLVAEIAGTNFTASATITSAAAVGDTVTLSA